jgi:predicted Rossmann fold flavoprotein
MLAAATAAERGKRTLLLEKNTKLGVKILISGGTRCNLTHDCDRPGILAAFGSAGSFLHSPLAALGPRELVQLFHAEGVPTYVEPGGKIFPQSDRALDVVRALGRRLERSGAKVNLAEPVTGVAVADEHGFDVVTALGAYDCQKLVVATGGKSYAGCGTTGDGYAWLTALGHSIRLPRPALAPVTCAESWVRDLTGLSLPAVRLTVFDPQMASARTSPGRRRLGLAAGVCIERTGAILFTHHGLSGPCALDVSREISKVSEPMKLILKVDFLPETSSEQLEADLRDAAQSDGKKLAVSLAPAGIQRRLAEALFVQAGIPLARRAADFSKREQSDFVKWLKAAEIHPTGTRGFAKAEVTAGGVPLDEVDSRTMESKRVAGLYLVGEILDLDGFIGGFNFQAAFSTGYLAGLNV